MSTVKLGPSSVVNNPGSFPTSLGPNQSGNFNGGGGVTPPPFDPTTVAGLTLWVRAEDLSQSDGQSVSNWPDLSGNGNHLNIAGATPPICKESIINGKKIVRFNGVNTTFLTTTVNGSSLFSVSALSFFAVLKSPSIALNNPNNTFWVNDTIVSIGSGWGGMYLRNNASPEALFGNYDGSSDVVSQATALNTPMLVHMRHGGGVLYGAVDDAAESSTASGNTAGGLNEKFLVGCQGNQPVTADIAEILVYDNAVGATDLDYLVSGLMSYYGIS